MEAVGAVDIPRIEDDTARVDVVAVDVAAQDGGVGQPVTLFGQKVGTVIAAIDCDVVEQLISFGAIIGNHTHSLVGTVDPLCYPDLLDAPAVGRQGKGVAQVLEGIGSCHARVSAAGSLIHVQAGGLWRRAGKR